SVQRKTDREGSGRLLMRPVGTYARVDEEEFYFATDNGTRITLITPPLTFAEGTVLSWCRCCSRRTPRRVPPERPGIRRGRRSRSWGTHGGVGRAALWGIGPPRGLGRWPGRVVGWDQAAAGLGWAFGARQHCGVGGSAGRHRVG